jgi:hypothetical protein
MLSIGFGGAGHCAGLVIRGILQLLSTFAASSDTDFALVTTEDSAWVVAQAEREGMCSSFLQLEPELRRTADQLAERAIGDGTHAHPGLCPLAIWN